MESVALLSLFLLVVILDGFSYVRTSARNPGVYCIESEKNALIKFRQGFKKTSQSMLSWMLEENCCSWEGVECDNTTGHVITLDLHKQFLQGIIPRCLDNFQTMSRVEEAASFSSGPYAVFRYLETLIFIGQSYDLDYYGHWPIIDLAENHLSGEIPKEITSLTALIGLNLSRNNFTGAIPLDIGNLQSMEWLDLSWNNLSGAIPPSIAELSFLEFANFSFNDLTGEIPSGSQFQTFTNDSYVGNPKLCGFPVQVCPNHLHEDRTHSNNKQEVQAVQHEENNWLEEYSFYISMGFGFYTGFWVFWAILVLKKSWRYAYMRCLDNMGNKIYVFAAISLKIIKQQRG